MRKPPLTFAESAGAVDPSRALIYLWEISDSTGHVCFRYVGKAAGGADRPRKHYRRNMENLLAGRSYRKGKPAEFREVHHRLAEAARQGFAVKLSFLCNVGPGENINGLERHWQHHFGLVPNTGKEAQQGAPRDAAAPRA